MIISSSILWYGGNVRKICMLFKFCSYFESSCQWRQQGIQPLQQISICIEKTGHLSHNFFFFFVRSTMSLLFELIDSILSYILLLFCWLDDKMKCVICCDYILNIFEVEINQTVGGRYLISRYLM